ncbi:MAG: GTPase HflX [Atopobium sp.]|uniref:GTPase HflX n=1 Tax=Atopobium sp. TaxID=1872650 RepID=UPI002A74DCC3|nr:GTPase HflX [Atopobium sp.]MDY2788213.1 GTPase HflX [Atopobium sp.]MDY4522575.1 GTPase HflX [Atopobium sp.]
MAKAQRFKPIPTAPVPERAILVGVDFGKGEWSVEESLSELERLAQTDGAEVIARLTQKLDTPVPKTFIGSGKAQELVSLVTRLEADVVIFDDELSPSQQANLEKILGSHTKVIDRTALILDIFGVHAKTREGRLQVQLAQLQYLYPRLRGMWSHLVGEQTRGGIGSRFGQGESQLEVDRRLVRKRIGMLKDALADLDVRRATQSKARWESGVWRVALAGYTNAGKSTLLNRLTGAEVYAKDELFATLDPTTRSLNLSEGRKITLTDTVGFIQKLPTTLIKSFNSTLAEVKAADLIVKVADASDSHVVKQLQAVDEVLQQIDAQDIPSLIVLNKCDVISPELKRTLSVTFPAAEFVSAYKGTNMDGLLYRIAKEASAGNSVITVRIPYDKGILLKMVHEQAQVIREEYHDTGLIATISVSARMEQTLEPYKIIAQS